MQKLTFQHETKHGIGVFIDSTFNIRSLLSKTLDYKVHKTLSFNIKALLMNTILWSVHELQFQDFKLYTFLVSKYLLFLGSQRKRKHLRVGNWKWWFN